MRHNNFDALRLIAALMVIHGHGMDLVGLPATGLWNLPYHRVGLNMFFSISGYLVTGSWERAPRLRSFLRKRALRIFPGLAACVLLTALLLGPLVTTASWPHYFAAGGLLYLTNAVLFLQLYLPGVFAHDADGGAVNGSLWSLAPEFCCYLTVPLLAGAPRRLRLASLLVLAGAAGAESIAIFAGLLAPLPLIWDIDPKYALAEFPFFAVGGILALLERDARTPAALWRADLCLVFLIANSCISAWFGSADLPVEWLTLPYLVVCFGRMALPVLSRAARWGDASYGTYLYAYPLQKLVLLLLPRDPFPVLTCAAASICAGLLSWHLVERPAQLWAEKRVKRRSTPAGAAQHAAQPLGQP